LCALLAHLISGGELTVDPADEITAGVLITHRGEVVHPAVKALLGAGPDRKAAPASDQGTQSADPPITAPSTVPTGKGQNG
jgi:hypothetical protein